MIISTSASTASHRAIIVTSCTISLWVSSICESMVSLTSRSYILRRHGGSFESSMPFYYKIHHDIASAIDNQYCLSSSKVSACSQIRVSQYARARTMRDPNRCCTQTDSSRNHFDMPTLGQAVAVFEAYCRSIDSTCQHCNQIVSTAPLIVPSERI